MPEADAPAWAQPVLEEARNGHPGRREGEVGISSLAYDPGQVNDRLQGRPVDGPSGDHLSKGTMLHDKLLGNAPYREVEVRLPVDGTPLYLNGRFDAYDPAEQGGTLHDLKTTDRWNVTETKREQYETQLLLYTACLKWGEVNVGTWENPNWQPAQDVLGDGAPQRAVVDLWPAGDIRWGYLEYEGDELEQLARGARSWATSEIRAMIAGSWTPTEDEDPEEYRSTPVAEGDTATLIELAGRAKEMRDEAGDEYDEYREELDQRLDETTRSGSWRAKKVSDSTKTVLDPEEAGEHVDLEEYHDRQPTARVTDADAFAHWAHNLGSEIPGVELDHREQLDEDAVCEALEELGVLDACQDTKTTRSGYITVERIDGGAS